MSPLLMWLCLGCLKVCRVASLGCNGYVDGYMLTFACCLLSAGNLADRLGAKRIFIIGLSLFGTASFTLPAATVATIRAASGKRAGIIASGAFNASRQIGSLIGVALFGTILATNHYFINGMRITLLLGAIAFFIGWLATLFFISENKVA